jgi:hypothetical protein
MRAISIPQNDRGLKSLQGGIPNCNITKTNEFVFGKLGYQLSSSGSAARGPLSFGRKLASISSSM